MTAERDEARKETCDDCDNYAGTRACTGCWLKHTTRAAKAESDLASARQEAEELVAALGAARGMLLDAQLGPDSAAIDALLAKHATLPPAPVPAPAPDALAERDRWLALADRWQADPSLDGNAAFEAGVMAVIGRVRAAAKALDAAGGK